MVSSRTSSKDLEEEMVTPVDNMLKILELLLEGEKPERELVCQLYDEIRSARNLRKPHNLQESLQSDPRLTRETGNALYSMIGEKSILPPRSSLDYIPRPSTSSLPESHLCSVAQTSWTFDSLQMKRPLATLALYIIRGENLIHTLQLDNTKLTAFLVTIEDMYRNVPYHNAYHACEVLQYVHILMTAGGVKERLALDDQTILACYIAALCHDVGHKGVTNDFLIKTSDDIAVTYNDTSPWENFHASQSIKVLRRPDCNFVETSLVDNTKFKNLVCRMILATDIHQHFELLSIFRGEKTIGKDDNHILTSLQLMLKCGDICHLCRSGKMHKVWVSRLEEEFLRQGDVERLREMPISMMMNRQEPLRLSDTQIGFFEIVALPLFKSFVEEFPLAQPMLELAQENMLMWQSTGQ